MPDGYKLFRPENVISNTPGEGSDTTGVELRGALKDIVFVDTSVPDYEVLIADIAPGTEVVLIAGSTGGLADVAAALSGRTDVGSVQLVSHGDVGLLEFGADVVTSDNLDDYAGIFEAIGTSIRDGGDVLLYGCRVGDGGAGMDFIEALATITGADVAASDDLTGAQSLGGDWDLEITTGDIEADLPFSESALSSFLQVLPFSGTIAFGGSSNAGGLTGGTDGSINATETVGSYTLVLDGAIRDTAILNGFGYTNNGESSLTLYFTGSGTTTFDATSIYLKTAGPSDAFTITSNLGGSVTGTATTVGGVVNLAGLPTGINSLTISIDDASVYYLYVDDFVVANVEANSAPTVSGAPSDVTVTEDSASNVDLSALSFADTNGDDITVTLSISSGAFSAPVDGSAVGAGVTETQVDGQTITLSGAAGDINTYLDTVSNIQYTTVSNANGAGVATLTVSATDGDASLASDPVINIDSTPQQDIPTLNVGGLTDVTVSEDTEGNIDLSSLDFSEVDGEAITVTLTIDAGSFSPPADGSGVGGGVDETLVNAQTITLVGAADDIDIYLDTASNIRYTGAQDVFGNDAATLTVSATDGTGPLASNPTINIDITAQNDDPTETGLVTDIAVTEETSGDFDLSAVTFADVDSTTGFTLTLTAGSGSLAASTGGGVTVGGSGTGVLTLDGTLADLNTFLDTASNIQYTGALDVAGNDAATVTVELNDGDGSGDVNLGAVNLDITDVNDAPTLTATGGDPTFTEGGAATDLFNTVSASTVEAGQSLTGFVLTVTNVSNGTDETLTIDGTSITLTDLTNGTTATNSLSYSVGVSGTTATITFSGGTLTAGTFGSILDGAAYANASDDPAGTGSRVVTVTSLTDNGGTANGGAETANLSIASTVTIAPVNDAPQIGNVTGETSSFSVGSGATQVDLFDDATVSDLDSADFNGGFLTITNLSGTSNVTFSFDGTTVTSGGDATIAAGETIQVNGTTIGTVDATDDGQGGNDLTITFSTANATPANIEDLLQNIAASIPSTDGIRGYTLSLNDNDGTANGGAEQATVSFNLQGLPNPPVIANLGGDSVSYSEGDTNALLDDGTAATVTDVDSADFNSGSLTVSITAGEDAAEDILTIDTTGAVSLSGTTAGSSVSVGGQVIGTLGNNIAAGNDLVVNFTTADATPANTETLLRALAYTNSDNDNPTEGARTVTISLDDGSTAADATAVTTVTVSAVNDDPTVASLPTDVTVLEETASDFDLSAANFADVDTAGSVTLTLTAASGTFAASSGGGVTIGGSATDTLTLDGTIADINTYLNTASNIQYTGSSDLSGDNASSVSVSVNDGEGSGDVALGTVNVDLTDINDAPTVSATAGDPTIDGGTGIASGLFSGTTASTTEAGQAFDGFTVTVDDLADGADESLNVDGTSVVLTNGTSGSTADNSLSYTVSVTGTTATVSFSGGSVSEADFAGIINSLSYSNAAAVPTGTGRTVTLTGVTDDGGTANGGVAATAVSIGSTVAFNALPTVSGTPADIVVTEDEAGDVDLSALTFADADGDTLTVTLSVDAGQFTGVADGAATGAGVTETLVDAQTITLAGTGGDISTYLDTASNIQYQGAADANGDNVASITVSAADGNGGSLAANPVVNIDITEVIDPPAFAGSLSGFTFTEDTDGFLSLAPLTLSADAASLTLTVTNPFGVFVAGSTVGVTVSGTGTSTLTLTGSPSDIDTYLNNASAITFSPNDNVFGTSNTGLVVRASDGSNDATVTTGITVTAVNDIPTASNAALDGGADVDLVLRVADFGFSDVETSAFATIRIDDTVTGLTLSGAPVADGAVISVNDVAAGNLRFNSANEGDFSFTFSLSDGTDFSASQTANITIDQATAGDRVAIDRPDLADDVVVVTVSDQDSSALDVEQPDGGMTTVTDDGIIVTTDNDDAVVFENGFSVGGRVELRGGDDLAIAGDGRDTIVGGLGNDNISGGGEADSLLGGVADDTVTGDDGRDTIGGGSGNDQLDGGGNDDVVYGRLGADAVVGGSGNDLLFNGEGDDTVEGGDGDDTLWSGAGNDQLSLGSGRDTVVISGDLGQSGSSDQDVIEDFALVDDVIDVRFAVASFNSFSDILAATTNVVLSGDTDPSAVIDLGNGETLALRGIDRADLTASNFRIDGQDVLVGTDSDDSLLGGFDNDQLQGGAGNDTLLGGGGNDNLIGGTGNDNLVGGSGRDSLFGGAGDAGDDTLAGGDSDDIIGSAAGNDQIDGGAGDDIIFGRSGDDLIFGGDGDDLIYNGTGNDTVDGGAGRDTIWSGAGDDLLTFGLGRDLLIISGEAGDNGSTGNDRVTDFDADEDVIDFRFALAGFSSLDDVIAAASEDTIEGVQTLVIDLGNGESLRLDGVQTSDLDADNVIFG